MMNYIWSAIIIFSLIAGIRFGKTGELTNAIIKSGNSAVDLCITLLGTFCLWNGIMSIAEKSGLTNLISRILSPLLRKIFRGIDKNDDAILPISLNITANLLGLSNAATPMGIEGMKRLAEKNQGKTTPSDNMVLFVVMNSAALRIIPTTVANIRADNGSDAPMEIILPSIFSSFLALTVGIVMAKITARYFKND